MISACRRWRRIGLVACFAVSVAGCDRLPVALSREESAFRACEAVILQRNDLGSLDRIWADFTPRGAISKEEYILRLEQQIARLRQVGDFGSNLSAHYMEKAVDCARTGDCSELETGEPPGGEPAAEGGGVSDNPLTYEGSGLATEDKTGFVLIEYRSDAEARHMAHRFHYCRMSSAAGHFSAGNVYLDGPVPDSEGSATKRLYDNL